MLTPPDLGILTTLMPEPCWPKILDSSMLSFSWPRMTIVSTCAATSASTFRQERERKKSGTYYGELGHSAEQRHTSIDYRPL